MTLLKQLAEQILLEAEDKTSHMYVHHNEYAGFHRITTPQNSPSASKHQALGHARIEGGEKASRAWDSPYDRHDEDDKEAMSYVKGSTLMKVTKKAAEHIHTHDEGNYHEFKDGDHDLHFDYKKRLISHKFEVKS